jgi:tetratricopeptide (TPR) repeat protein
MAYWGEAMTQNHPLWEEQAAELARDALSRMKGLEKATPRERGFIEAVKVLYGEGEKKARDAAYSAAMEKLRAQFPKDDEIALFYALSLMGRPDGRDVRPRMQAGAIALEVLLRNPMHPGAAHYAIHAFDDAEHAILGLPAARKYAQIAPAAPHAKHMPSHIFAQLGMWNDAIASNEVAWAASEAWVAKRHKDQDARDWHSRNWQVAIYLEQGRMAKAKETLQTFIDAVPKSRDMSLRLNYLFSIHDYMAMTEEWSRLDEMLAVLDRLPPADAGGHAGCDTLARPDAAYVKSLVAELHAQAAAHAGKVQLDEFRAAAKALPDTDRTRKFVERTALEVQADAADAQKNRAKAIELYRKAVAIEDASGLPVGPGGGRDAHTRLGELLMAEKKPADALKEFTAALKRYANRGRPLLGAARAAAASGDRELAQQHYRELVSLWKDADTGWPGLSEAQGFLAAR